MRISAALLCLCAAVARGESYDWVSTGSRRDNPIVLQLLLESDRDTAEAVAAALAARTDGYVEDIIAGLLDQHSATSAGLVEAYLQRVTSRPDAARSWAAANPAATRSLTAALPHLRDGYSRAAVLRLLPFAPGPDAAATAAAALARVAAALTAGDGHAAGGQRAELFAALAAADLLRAAEVARSVVEIARISRDADCVSEARRVAARLLGQDLAQ